MPSPFPGMDPYLEGSAWESFHAALIDEIVRQLAPKLRPKYLVRVERRLVVGISEIADAAAARQRSVSIVDVAERTLVAAIELLSPTNKRSGGGREEYLQRRENFLAGDAHLIEIDLLRRGTRLPMRGVLPPAPYYGFVSRAGRRPMTGVWPIALRGPLPTIPVPLLPDDPDVPLDLQAALTGAYDAFGFDLEIDYHHPPEFPLPPEEAAWVREQLGIPPEIRTAKQRPGAAGKQVTSAVSVNAAPTRDSCLYAAS